MGSAARDFWELKNNGRLNSGNYLLEIDQLNEIKWAEYLELFDDANIYQTWAYGKFQTGGNKISHLVLKLDGKVVALSQARILTLPFFNRGIAYIFFGPLWKLKNGIYDRHILQEFLYLLYSEYAVKRKLLLRIVPGIYGEMENEYNLLFENCGLKKNIKYKTRSTIILDLGISLEEISNHFKGNLRRKLKHAEGNCLDIVTGKGENLLMDFMNLYKQLLQLKEIPSPQNIMNYVNIQRALPEKQKLQAFICKAGNEPVAGIIISFMGNSAVILLAAANSTGRNLSASPLLFWKAISWLKENGCRYLDLGGIDPVENPGGYRFKSEFGGREVEFIGQYESCQNQFSHFIVNAGEYFKQRNKIYLRR